MKRTETKKIALASIFCSLSVIVSVIGCVFDMADLVAASAASVTVAISKIELGKKYPYLIYAVTGTLLFLLFPSATVTWYFIMLFGYYPILQSYISKFPSVLRRTIKFIIFNIAIFAIYFLLMKTLLLSPDAESESYLLPALWIIANIFLAVFDYSLSVFILAYIRVFRKKWGIDKFMLTP